MLDSFIFTLANAKQSMLSVSYLYTIMKLRFTNLALKEPCITNKKWWVGQTPQCWLYCYGSWIFFCWKFLIKAVCPYHFLFVLLLLSISLLILLSICCVLLPRFSSSISLGVLTISKLFQFWEDVNWDQKLLSSSLSLFALFYEQKRRETNNI